MLGDHYTYSQQTENLKGFEYFICSLFYSFSNFSLSATEKQLQTDIIQMLIESGANVNTFYANRILLLFGSSAFF